jgi:hypothetical protein
VTCAADLILTMLDRVSRSWDDFFPNTIGNWDNKYDHWHNKWPVSEILASILGQHDGLED